LRAWEAVGLEPLTPHEARHTCASYLAVAGLTPKEAQTAMGYADIRTTLNIYAKAVPGLEARATAKLDAYLDDSSGPAANVLRLNELRHRLFRLSASGDAQLLIALVVYLSDLQASRDPRVSPLLGVSAGD
jgi:hypothetical protein